MTVNSNESERANKGVLELWKERKATEKGAKVVKIVQGMGAEGYIDINEAAKVLDRSVDRVRQIYWDNRLGKGKKV